MPECVIRCIVCEGKTSVISPYSESGIRVMCLDCGTEYQLYYDGPCMIQKRLTEPDSKRLTELNSK